MLIVVVIVAAAAVATVAVAAAVASVVVIVIVVVVVVVVVVGVVINTDQPIDPHFCSGFIQVQLKFSQMARRFHLSLAEKHQNRIMTRNSGFDSELGQHLLHQPQSTQRIIVETRRSDDNGSAWREHWWYWSTSVLSWQYKYQHCRKT